MKYNLRDFTFLILIRLDSIQRLENILAITNSLCRYFDTHIIVLESSSHNNGILKSLLNKKIDYRFVVDKDPIFFKTKYINLLLQDVQTPFLSIWDADIVVDKQRVIEATSQLQNNIADVALPYDGTCFDVPEILRNLYLKNKNIKCLQRNKNKMNFLHNKKLVGGAVFIRKDKFIMAGMDNEIHYGWGNDDFDRFERFKILGYTIFRTNNPLFHLYHPRGINSFFGGLLMKEVSTWELASTINSSAHEILNKQNN